MTQAQSHTQRKIKLFSDTVLRKNENGELFLMNHPEKGWKSLAITVKSIESLLETYDVTIGEWTKDKWSDYVVVRMNRPSGQE